MIWIDIVRLNKKVYFKDSVHNYMLTKSGNLYIKDKKKYVRNNNIAFYPNTDLEIIEDQENEKLIHIYKSYENGTIELHLSEQNYDKNWAYIGTIGVENV